MSDETGSESGEHTVDSIATALEHSEQIDSILAKMTDLIRTMEEATALPVLAGMEERKPSRGEIAAFLKVAIERYEADGFVPDSNYKEIFLYGIHKAGVPSSVVQEAAGITKKTMDEKMRRIRRRLGISGKPGRPPKKK